MQKNETGPLHFISYKNHLKLGASGSGLYIILATQKAEIRRIMVQSQPKKIVCENLSGKNPSQIRLIEWLKV
jgi:hypothetical protein